MKAQQLVALLVPVQKAYCSDRGFEACVLGQQVLGGHGYIAEWGLEQNVRDARIAQIYEGANGIQALDLMGRKTVRNNGELLQVLMSEVESFQQEQQGNEAMAKYLPALETARQKLLDATATVIAQADENPDAVGAASYPYMELLGLTLYCFMWQRILATAIALTQKGAGNAEQLGGIIKTGDYFLTRMLPKSEYLVAEIAAGSEPVMAVTEAEF